MKKAMIVLLVILGPLAWLNAAEKEGPKAQATVSAAVHEQVKVERDEAKAILANWAIYIRQLEKQNQQLSQIAMTAKNMADDLSKIKTLDELDEVLKKYGIERNVDGN